MKRYVSSPIYMVSMLIGAAIALFLSKGASPQASQDKTPSIVNMTEALKVESLVSVEAVPGAREKSCILTLKNVSSKKIVAWVINSPSGTMIAVGAIMSNRALEPGESYRHEVVDTSLDKPGPNQITVSLAMFQDGSSEGDLATHELIMNSRLASKQQMERINEILRAALESRQKAGGRFTKTDKEWLEDIASEISKLPEDAPSGQPSVAHGLISAKEGSLRLLKTLREWEDTRRTDAAKASRMLRERGSLFGASDVQDGVVKIIRYNEDLLEKNALKRRLQ